LRRRSENQLVAPAIKKKNGIPQRLKYPTKKVARTLLLRVLDVPASQIIKWMESME
jgi:hypothetical protein